MEQFLSNSTFVVVEELEEVYLDTALESAPLIGKKNFSDIIDDITKVLKKDLHDPSHGFLFLFVMLTVAWTVYIVLYNSRVMGSILTLFLRRCLKDSNLYIGSFSLSVLSGKVMFRNITYVTDDYSIRVVDGILRFRYWLQYVKKQLCEDMSHSDYRVYLELNGLELHIYNRSKVYGELEKIFGLEESLNKAWKKSEDFVEDNETMMKKRKDIKFYEAWRDLIPVIKIDLNMARFVFGNRLVPSTLLLMMDKAECYYSTKPAACNLDFFMHIVHSKAENFRVILAPSPKYTGILDEPPRYMGEGFVVMSSSQIRFYYYMDEAGFVPEEPQLIKLPNGDEVTAPYPAWGLDIRCEKGTTLSYGPWADHQRDQLFRLFFPHSYQKMQPSVPPASGEIRQVQQFDIRLSFLTEATIDILFSKEKETKAIHMLVQRGSYFDMILPWRTSETGYTTKINGQLFHVEASTSLLYRSLLDAECITYSVAVHYPCMWNHHQNWDLFFSGNKVTYHFLYIHKVFFQDLFADWSSKESSDLLHFVPYTWNFGFELNQFELVTLANEYNWVDCSSQYNANAHIAFCGEEFALNFSLPFCDFLPQTVSLMFIVKAETVDLSIFLPPSCTTQNIIAALDRYGKVEYRFITYEEPKWRNFCKLSSGWIDCWRVPEIELSVSYTYHPMPSLGPAPQADVSTPEKEEILLSPIRAPHKKPFKSSPKIITRENFDPTTLSADMFSVDLRILKPSEMKIYGSVLRHFIHLKENIFGDYQKYVDMSEQFNDDAFDAVDKETKSVSSREDGDSEMFDCRKYRPFEVTVCVDIQNVVGHLMKDCIDTDPPCPTLALDHLIFEMDKQYHETLLQVVVSPVILTTVDCSVRKFNQSHLQQGFVLLSGLQMRGHAMFSDAERALSEGTLEYAWLVELTIGSLSTKITTPHLQHIITGIETFVFTVCDSENCLRPVCPYLYCYHGVQQSQCSHTSSEHFCPTIDSIKYKMIRVSIDAVNFHLVESGTDLNLQIYPIRLSTCNLHGQHTRSGITVNVQNIQVHNYITGSESTKSTVGGDAPSSSSIGLGVASSSGNEGSSSSGGDIWLEVASAVLGPIFVDAAISCDILHHDMQLIQQRVLELHDTSTKRLSFLWTSEATPKVYGKCGCVGGCKFFGANRNGPSFFNPSQQDFVEGINIAQFRVNESDEDIGYGQSLLRRGELVFDEGIYSHLIYYHQDSEYEQEHHGLSSGYSKHDPARLEYYSVFSRSGSVNPSKSDLDMSRLHPRHCYQHQFSQCSDTIQETDLMDKPATYSGSYGNLPKDFGALTIPCSDAVAPGSLSDLRLSSGSKPQHQKRLSSLSLHAGFPLGVSTATVDPQHLLKDEDAVDPKHAQLYFHRATSLSSDAYFSADDEDVVSQNQRFSSLSTASSAGNLSGHTKLEAQVSNYTENTVDDIKTMYTESYSPTTFDHDDASFADCGDLSIEHRKSASSSSISSDQSSDVCTHPKENQSHLSLLHSSKSDLSHDGELFEMDEKYEKDKNILETGSASSTSFLSAVSSQDDIALVDLHMQLNKPIMESPLLMSSYINHMTQARCLNWEAVPPCFATCTCGTMFNIQKTPIFEKISEGFTSIRMKQPCKTSFQNCPPPSTHTPCHPYLWESPIFTWGTEQSDDNKTGFEDGITTQAGENTTQTILVIKLKNNIDVSISPMVLESAQLFIETLTPVLGNLHPLTIINHAHFRALSKVESKNTLKKKRYMYWSHLREDKKVIENSGVVSSTYQESCFQQIQGQIHIPKVNITFLQASVVEEVISFSALDNIRDLTCVSLFAFCFDNVDLQFYSGHQSKKSVQIFMRDVKETGKKKKSKAKARQNVDLLSDPVYIETSERQQEENKAAINISKIHIQLRRLRNESVLLKDASITSIPNHRSKVLFTFYHAADGNFWSGHIDEEGAYPIYPIELEHERLGFIMFEAGIENLSLKALKRKGFGLHSDAKHLTAHISKNICCETNNSLVSKTTPSLGVVEKQIHETKEDCEPSVSVSESSNISVHSATAQTQSSASGTTASTIRDPFHNKNNKDITSFFVEFNSVWLNFAAPPCTPINRKVDFTRLDWNFLSTASPSINAWMTPSDRLTVVVIQFLHSSEIRKLGVTGCVMAEALDVPSIHVPTKNKYVKLMPLSQTLQDDPSCQLCNVLRRYVLLSELSTIEENLKEPYLPKLGILRQAVVVLSRQWKNALYMPMLLEQSFKIKQAARPVLRSRSHVLSKLIENAEITDEKATFLETERGSLNSQKDNVENQSNAAEEPMDLVLSSGSTQLPPKQSLPSYPPISSRASIVFPVKDTLEHTNKLHLSNLEATLGHFSYFHDSISKKKIKNAEAKMALNKLSIYDDEGKLHKSSATLAEKLSLGSDKNLDECDSPKHLDDIVKNDDLDNQEDLYNWMTKQEEYNCTLSHRPTVTFSESIGGLPTISEGNNETIILQPLQEGVSSFYKPQDFQFLEAHVIFEPFLSGLGVVTKQVSGSAFEQLGSNVSVNGNVGTLRVDIVESDISKINKRKGRSGGSGRLYLDIGSELPAFLCQHTSIVIDAVKVTDESHEWVHKQPTLYISRSALKKRISTRIHFSLNISFLEQQVNMPLLRLLRQISSMYENARQTQIGLREQRPALMSKDLLNPKQKSGSYSEIHETDYKTVEYSFSISEEQVTLSSAEKEARGSIVSSFSAQVTPPPASTNARLARPQSFAQRLRSAGKMGRGYRNLGIDKIAGSPIMTLSASGSALEGATFCSSDKSPLLGPSEPAPKITKLAPKCWRNIYYLLDLYTTTPETKTIHHRVSLSGDATDSFKKNKKYILNSSVDIEAGLPAFAFDYRNRSSLLEERMPLEISGDGKIQRTKLLASLSGLKLEAEVNAIHSSITFREKIRSTWTMPKQNHKTATEFSVTGDIGSTIIVLLEGISPNQQTVVSVSVGKSQGGYASLVHNNKGQNTASITIGDVGIEIPQHPVILHDMMTRGSKQLSSTLQELRVARPTTRLSRGATVDEPDITASPRLQQEARGSEEAPPHLSTFIQPLAVRFCIVLQSVSVQAALLPSLQAQYRMEHVSSRGISGIKAKFSVHLPVHRLSFSTHLQGQPNESNLPSAASIALPQVHVEAEYIQDEVKKRELCTDGMILKHGNYLKAIAEIGALEHSLTTDLLNHLVFVQKVFMKEVNEVLQKMAGGDKPVPIWTGDEEHSSHLKHLLFSLQLHLQGVIITATTPTQSAVRLETGVLELELNNRVANVNHSQRSHANTVSNKVFGKAQVEINLALGQLLKNDVFEEAEPELQQLAYFRTRICLRNVFHNELTSLSDEGEVLLIRLTRPLICIQPMAVDRAVLVWLNYKNAYEYWTEQRASLNKEVLRATQQVFERVPQFSSLSSAAGIKSNLFLQLTVDDIGICLPLNPHISVSSQVDATETRDALVITLESTSISACNSGCLVCTAKFCGFCMRFAPEFETGLDEWKPDLRDPNLMNLCTVSEGTYEVCSRTVAPTIDKGNAKWMLNVQWQMEGMDLHLDINIGKYLTALASTLTMLTGIQDSTVVPQPDFDSDDEDTDNADLSSQPERPLSKKHLTYGDGLPDFLFDAKMDARERAKLLENEMNEQAKTVNDLKMLGASAATVKQEMKRLKELEAVVRQDFCRDVFKRIRKQSIKASSVKDILGIGPKGQIRSKSFRIPSPTIEVKEPVSERFSHSSSGDHASVSINGSPNHSSSNTESDQKLTLSSTLKSSDTNTIDEPELNEVFLPIYSGGDTHEDDLSPVDTDPTLLHKESVESMFEEEPNSNLQTTPEVCIKSTSCVNNITKNISGSVSSGISTGRVHGSSVLNKRQDLSIDLELDVKVCINSGGCILYNRDFSKEDELKRMKKEKSFSGAGFDAPGSPGPSKRKPEMRAAVSTSLLRQQAQPPPSLLSELTVFFIPGLDVTVHYESHTIREGSPKSPDGGCWSHISSVENMKAVPEMSTPQQLNSSNIMAGGQKKASLFAWLTLQSIPDEAVISPSILDFFELALEPIPVTVTPKPFSSESPLSDAPDVEEDIYGSNSGPAGVVSNYTSFPVDVIVYFHMEQSTIRFSCHPVSRVECLLQLPSLNLMFSSKRAGDLDHCKPDGKLPSIVGGLSMTGVLEDFNLFVFHPYGGKQKGYKHFSTINESERKDSLSMTVEFVKLHISRSRKVNFFEASLKNKSDTSKATIRFTTIVDIGAALFKYDMRRLAEILAFPRAWYRRSIVRRLFLGDSGGGSVSKDFGESSSTTLSSDSTFSTGAKRQSASSCPDVLDALHPNGEGTSYSASAINSFSSRSSSQAWTKDKLYLNLEGEASHKSYDSTNEKSVKSSSGSWETLVLFAVNFTKLNVHMNMGNVMGNVVWTTKAFKADGHLSIGSSGHKNMYIGIGFDWSGLEAKGGIVGGTVELADISTYVKILEDPKMEPDHTLGIKLFASQTRFDYMGTCVLMGRVSSFGVTLKDEWKHRQLDDQECDSTRRDSSIFIIGDLEWDQLQLLISKSTTADLYKMHHKLEEFFTQQFKSSKRVFSSLQPVRSKSMRHKHTRQKLANVLGVASAHDCHHHRHWQHVLSLVSGLKLTTLEHPFPIYGTVLGGSLELRGKTISLACFRGVNFKSKSWALFSLKEPFISFTSEVQELPGEAPRDTHIIQNLTCSLGIMQKAQAQHISMATVCRITRSMVFPPQFRTPQEWFHYAFCTSELDNVDRFPSMGANRTDSLTSTSSNDPKKSSTQLQDHNHSSETIFALPSMEIHLNTKHLQTAQLPDFLGVKPKVECSLITEFQDHIFVTIDAENFFFLHDLISSYVKDTKEKMGQEALAKEGEKKTKTVRVNEPTQFLQQDWREFTCTTWHLEPTVRLLSWATKNLEPYGVDYILHKLGFSHARTTIPKWLQRGCMDPLDKVLSVFVGQMIATIHEHESNR